MIDFHGSTGYGQAFTDAISQHWGDRPLEDLQKGWAARAEEVRLPRRRQGLRARRQLRRLHGQLDRRQLERSRGSAWSTTTACSTQRMMGYATEELWFTEWENGGTPFDKPEELREVQPGQPRRRSGACRCWSSTASRTSASRSSRASPRSPRCSARASSRKFLYFPDENHWVLKPQNSVQWHDTVNALAEAAHRPVTCSVEPGRYPRSPRSRRRVSP